jgi:endonuclease/exonuclease/phosphatase (EEP) superfamily protein YafD
MMPDPTSSAPALPVPPAISAGSRRLADQLRGALGLFTWLYGLSLVVLFVALEWWGESNWLLSLPLFAPPQLFLAPLLLLTPACLLVRPRLCLWHIAFVVAVAFGFMTFRWAPRPAPDGPAITVVTHNAGQGNVPQFDKFLATGKPDVILLQDARSRAPRFSARHPEYEVAVCGEYVLASRHRIRQAVLLAEPNFDGRPLAARFEVELGGKPVAFYGVHFPTPRGQFHRFLSRRLVGDFLGEGTLPGGFAYYSAWISTRHDLARSLAKLLENEPLPFIVGGDFNMPDHGAIYHLFARQMDDAFARSGRGWGMTFPGYIRQPAGLLGPWLRLDYLFAGRGWTPISCDVEPGRESQHCAVVARFIPKPGA